MHIFEEKAKRVDWGGQGGELAGMGRLRILAPRRRHPVPAAFVLAWHQSLPWPAAYGSRADGIRSEYPPAQPSVIDQRNSTTPSVSGTS